MFPLENNAEKSVENFKTKIRAKACTITIRSHNLDDLTTHNTSEPDRVRHGKLFRYCRIK